MVAGAFAATVSCVVRMALGGTTSYDASLETIGRLRTQVATEGVLKELELDPRLGLGWVDGRDELGAAYHPRLLLQQEDSELQVLHQASLTGARQLDGRWRATASLNGSYGTTDLFLLTVPVAGTSQTTPPPSTTGSTAPPTAQPIQPVPSLARLKYVSGEATVQVVGASLGRFRLIGNLTAGIAGGADPVARASLPLERSGSLASTLEWIASGLDVFATDVGVTLTSFETGITDGYALATETWRHALSPDVQFRLGAGPAVTIQNAAGQTTWGFGPAGGVAVHDHYLTTLDLDLGVLATPLVDRVSGNVYDRADATAVATWHPAAAWTAALTGTAGIVLQGPDEGDEIAAGDLRVGWMASPHFGVTIGASGLTQRPHAAGAGTLKEGSVYVDLVVREAGQF